MKTEPTNVVREAIRIALSRAQQISWRAGVSWALIDGLEDVVNCDAVIAGLDKQKIVKAIQDYSDTLDHLFISIEPNVTAFDVADLLRAINNSQCNHITIGHHLADSVADLHWRQWERSWAGEVNYLSFNSVANQLSSGITMIKEQRRPWLIAVSASCLESGGLPLTTFLNALDFLPYLKDLLQQQRALFYSSTQAELLRYLPSCNFLQEPLDRFEIFDAGHLKSILQYCALQERCSAIILCDMPLLEFLMEQNLVDEVVHHIWRNTSDGAMDYARQGKYPTEALFDSRRWTLVANTAMDKYNRVIMRKQFFHKRIHPEPASN